MNITSFNKVFAGGYISTYALASVPAYLPARYFDTNRNKEMEVHVHVHMQMHLPVLNRLIFIAHDDIKNEYLIKFSEKVYNYLCGRKGLFRE